jgi:HDOD domain
VLKTGVLEFPSGRCILAEPRTAHHQSADNLPDVPVLPETLLAMELQLRHSPVDLGEFSQVVLHDVGATLQILRLACREYDAAENHLLRIEDCICDFGPAACFQAVAKGSVVRSHQRRAVAAIWTHAREIADNAKHLAEEISSAITPDQAYIAGLLHSMGSLPAALAWRWSEASHDTVHTGWKLAERWAFPGYLRDFFCEMIMPGYCPQWSEIMAAAHRDAGSPAQHCALCAAAIRPSA